MIRDAGTCFWGNSNYHYDPSKCEEKQKGILTKLKYDSTSSCNDIFVSYPNTRKLFNVLKNNTCGFCGIAGSRMVGKTILLKQLCNTMHGIYYNADLCIGEEYDDLDFNLKAKSFCDEIISVIATGDCPVFIDEITAIPTSVLRNFIVNIKQYNDLVPVFYTGSYPLAVKNIAYGTLGRGSLYELYSLNYDEYLTWSNSKVSKDTMLDYFKYSITEFNNTNMDTEEFLENYVKSILSCARCSYLYHSGIDNDKFLFEPDAFSKLITYLKSSLSFDVSGNNPKDLIRPYDFIVQKEMTNTDIEDFKDSIGLFAPIPKSGRLKSSKKERLPSCN